MTVARTASILRSLALASLLVFADPSLAVDPSVYYGEWSTREGHPSIHLKIDRTVELTVDENSVGNVRHSFHYGEGATFPFLFVHASQPAGKDNPGFLQYTHLLYLILGGSEGQAVVRGFYDYERIYDDLHGSMDSASVAVDLHRKPSPTHAQGADVTRAGAN